MRLLGKVFASAVDHVVSPQPAKQLQLPREIDRRHQGTACPRELQRHASDVSTGAVDQHVLPCFEQATAARVAQRD